MSIVSNSDQGLVPKAIEAKAENVGGDVDQRKEAEAGPGVGRDGADERGVDENVVQVGELKELRELAATGNPVVKLDDGGVVEPPKDTPTAAATSGMAGGGGQGNSQAAQVVDKQTLEAEKKRNVGDSDGVEKIKSLGAAEHHRVRPEHQGNADVGNLNELKAKWKALGELAAKGGVGGSDKPKTLAKCDELGEDHVDSRVHGARANLVNMPTPKVPQVTMEKLPVGGNDGINKEKSQTAAEHRFRPELLGKEMVAKELVMTMAKTGTPEATNLDVPKPMANIGDVQPKKHAPAADAGSSKLEDVGVGRRNDATEARPIATIVKPRMTVEEARARRMRRTISEYAQYEEDRQHAAAAAPPRRLLVEQEHPAPRLPKAAVKPKIDRPPIVDAVLIDRAQATTLLANAMALERAQQAARELRQAAERAEDELGTQLMAAERELTLHLSPSRVGAHNASVVQSVLRRAQVRSESRASRSMGAAMARAKRSEGSRTASELSSRHGIERRTSITAAVTRELVTAPVGAELPGLLDNYSTFAVVLDTMHQRQQARQALPKMPRLVTVSPTTSTVEEESEPTFTSAVAQVDDDHSDHGAAGATVPDDDDLLTMLFGTFIDEPSAIERLVQERTDDFDEGPQREGESTERRREDEESMDGRNGSDIGDSDGEDIEESVDDYDEALSQERIEEEASEGRDDGSQNGEAMSEGHEDEDGQHEEQPVGEDEPTQVAPAHNFTLNMSSSPEPEPAHVAVLQQDESAGAEGDESSRHRLASVEGDDEEEENRSSDDSFLYRFRIRAEEGQQRDEDHVQPLEDPIDDETPLLEEPEPRAEPHDEYHHIDELLRRAREHFQQQQANLDECAEVGTVFTKALRQKIVSGLPQVGVTGQHRSPPQDTDDDQEDVMSDGGEQEAGDDDEPRHIVVPQPADEQPSGPSKRKYKEDDETAKLGPALKRQYDAAEALLRFVVVGEARSIAQTTRPAGPHQPKPAAEQLEAQHRQWTVALYVPPVQREARDVVVGDDGKEDKTDVVGQRSPKRKAVDDEQTKKQEPSPKRQRENEETGREDVGRFVIVGQATSVSQTMRPAGPHQPKPAAEQLEVQHRQWTVALYVPPVARLQEQVVEQRADPVDADVVLHVTPPPSPGRIPQGPQQSPPHQQLQQQGAPAGGPGRRQQPVRAKGWNRLPGERLLRNRGVPAAPRRALGLYPVSVPGAIAHGLARIERFFPAILDHLEAGGDGLNAALQQQTAATRARTALRRLERSPTATMDDVRKVLGRLERVNEGFAVLF